MHVGYYETSATSVTMQSCVTGHFFLIGPYFYCANFHNARSHQNVNIPL